MNRNNAAGQDQRVIEMLSALEKFRINNIIEIINENMTVVKYQKILVFIALPKKSDANGYKLHQSISLMSHMTGLTSGF